MERKRGESPIESPNFINITQYTELPSISRLPEMHFEISSRFQNAIFTERRAAT